MESRTKAPFLTPTYQNILIMDLRQVNECFFAGDYMGSYEALRILYSDMLKKPRKEIEKDWEKFVTEKNSTSAAGTYAKRNLKLRDRQNDYLYANIPHIKARFIEVLEKNKLLDMETGATPRSIYKPHIGAT